MAQVTICFDLDGVLCSQTDGDYERAIPNWDAIAVANQLFTLGARIIVHTSRFMGRTNDPHEAHRVGFDVTSMQLRSWGVQYHELILGKPRYDIVVDDRALFFTGDWSEIRRALLARVQGR